jgi:hypothetical protein
LEVTPSHDVITRLIEPVGTLSRMNLALARLLYEHHLVFEQAVVDAAVEELVSGTDSPSLRLLAGLGPRELDQTRDLLGRASVELGLPPPDDDVPGVLKAGNWLAAEALQGRVDTRRAVSWIAYSTWRVYADSADFEPDPDKRPHEVQMRVDAIELADVLSLDYVDLLPEARQTTLVEKADSFLRGVAGGARG